MLYIETVLIFFLSFGVLTLNAYQHRYFKLPTQTGTNDPLAKPAADSSKELLYKYVF